MALNFGYTEKFRAFWHCQCDCGKKGYFKAKYLLNGDTKSCGCLSREVVIKRNTTHGLSRTPTYGIWRGMKSRCLNPNDQEYSNYGGRGITIHSAWLNDFQAFLNDVGEKPSPKHSIERKDFNGNYEPENVCWILMSEQGKNTRRVQFHTINGITDNITGHCKRIGLTFVNYRKRIIRGWTVKDALSVPPRTQTKLSVLKTEDVLFIRKARDNKTHRITELMKMFNVSRNTISLAARRVTWKNIAEANQ